MGSFISRPTSGSAVPTLPVNEKEPVQTALSKYEVEHADPTFTRTSEPLTLSHPTKANHPPRTHTFHPPTTPNPPSKWSEAKESHEASSSADVRFRQIYTDEWAWRQTEHLEPTEDSDGSAGHLPRVDARSQRRRLAKWTSVLHALDALPPVSEGEHVNFVVYKAQIKSLEAAQRFKEYEKPLNGDTAFWNILTGAARRKFGSQKDYADYLAQLGEVGRYFEEQMENMQSGLERGFTAPKVTLIGRDATLVSVLEAKTSQDSVYYQPFLAMPASISPTDQATLRKRGATVIRDIVLPAYRRLLAFLQDEYFPRAREELAAETLPDGKAYYQSKIVEFTTTDLRPKQIHQLGLEEMTKIRREMDAVIRSTGFQGDFAAFLVFLRGDKRFYALTEEELLKDAAWIAKEFDGAASTYFGRLPRQRFTIVPVPLDQAPFFTSGRGGNGVYYVNTYDLPSRPLYSLPALTLHESAPGHTFQMALADEHELPAFRNAYISAYGEGWALYCEHLGVEMGSYHTAYETFGMLSYQAWRAARLVIDTGVHAFGWSRNRAQRYLQDNTALSTHEVETEVDRYISWPGQALAYYLGMLEIRKVRAKAEKQLGGKFNIKAFHDAVLQTGSVPLPLLVEHIDRFIAGGGLGPYPNEE